MWIKLDRQIFPHDLDSLPEYSGSDSDPGFNVNIKDEWLVEGFGRPNVLI